MAETLSLVGISKFKTPGGIVRMGVLRGTEGKGPVPYMDIHPLIDQFNTAYRSSVRLPRPDVMDAVLASSEDNWKFFAGLGCNIFPTSAVAAYRAPHAKLGNEVTYAGVHAQRICFSYAEHDGIKDTTGVMVLALKVASADFKTRGDIYSLLAPRDIELFYMPDKSGLYRMKNGIIPSLKPAQRGSKSARFVEREESADTVAPLVREIGQNGERVNLISLACSPFEKYDVVVELSLEDWTKLEQRVSK
jgi:hypothetical protein